MAHGFEAIQLSIILKIAAFIFLAPLIGMVVAFGFICFFCLYIRKLFCFVRFLFCICLRFSEILLLIASMCFLLGSNQPPSKVNGANACVMTHFYCYCIICICLCQSVLTVFTNKTDVIAYKNSVSFLCNLPISQEKPCRRPSMRQSYSTFSHSVFSPLLPSISKFHPESYVQPQPCSEAPAEFPPPWKSSLPHSYPCRNHCLQS